MLPVCDFSTTQALFCMVVTESVPINPLKTTNMKSSIKENTGVQDEKLGKEGPSVEVRMSPLTLNPNRGETPVSKACLASNSSSSFLEAAKRSASPLAFVQTEDSDTDMSDAYARHLREQHANFRRKPGSQSFKQHSSGSSSERSRQRSQQYGGSRYNKNKQPSSGPKVRLPARANIKACYVNASINKTRSEELGRQDAEKQVAALNGDEERDSFFRIILDVKLVHIRELGCLLASYFWAAKIWTSSYAILGVLDELRTYGLQFEFSEDPDVVLGAPGGPAAPYLITAAGQGSIDQVPYYDLCVPYDVDREYPYLVHRGGHHELVATTNLAGAWPRWHPVYRFGLDTMDSQRMFCLLFQKDPSRKGLTRDALVRSLMRASRTYSEAVFSVAMQYIGDHTNLPTYWTWQPGVATETVICVLEENANLLRQRLEFSERSSAWDDKYLESFSGVSVAGKSIASTTLLDFFDRWVVPGANRITKKMQKAARKIREAAASVRQWSAFDPDEPDSGAGVCPPPVPPRERDKESSKEEDVPQEKQDGPSGFVEEPAAEEVSIILEEISQQDDIIHEKTEALSSSAKPQPVLKNQMLLEALARDVEREIHILNEGFEELEPFDFEAGDLEPENFIFLMCFQGCAETISHTCGRSLAASCVEFLDVLPMLPLHPLVSAYNHVADRYFFFPRVIAFTRFMHLRTRLTPYDAEGNTMSLFVTTNEFPSARDPIHLPVFYVDHHKDDARLVNGVAFTQAELCSFDHGDIVPFRQQFDAHLELNPLKRIRIKGEPNFRHGFISEVYYVNFFRPGLCFTRGVLPYALVNRLNRPVPTVQPEIFPVYARFDKDARWPRIEYEVDRRPVTEEEFLVFLDKMPSMSRRKHLNHFRERMRVNGVQEMPKKDSCFPKYDEVLFSPKARLIINPPSELFYRLVCSMTMAKKALKRHMMFIVYDAPRQGSPLTIWFAYGADMTIAQKSKWFSKSLKLCKDSAHRTVVSIVVGGDDNACIVGHNRTVFAWESDVTACDQSHNSTILNNCVLQPLRAMGMVAEDLQEIRDSYYRPLSVDDMKIYFEEPQLHTGHPITSLANTLAVGKLCSSIMASVKTFALDEPEFLPAFEAHIRERALQAGMLFKVQVHENPYDLTFHKGHWVPCDRPDFSDHVWMPLPSCLWKACKIRTDSHISRKELLLRMAYNLYQRLIVPNATLVRKYAEPLFYHLLRLGEYDKPIGAFDAYIQHQFRRFHEKAQLQKNGELALCEPLMFMGEKSFWDEEMYEQFFSRRYGVSTSECFPGDGTFRGVRCFGWESVITRDYGVDTTPEMFLNISRCSPFSVSSSNV